MPTVKRIKGYRFYFYSNEMNEPGHVHIDKGGASAKNGLYNHQVAEASGYSEIELRLLKRLVFQHKKEFMEAWNAHFFFRRRK